MMSAKTATKIGWVPTLAAVLTGATAAAPLTCPKPTGPEPLPSDLPAAVAAGDLVRLRADRIDLSRDEQAHFGGSVDIVQGEQWVRADEVTVDRTTDEARASGNVRYVEPNLSLEADRATVDLATDRAVLETVEYRLGEGSGRGRADLVEQLDEDTSRLTAVTYTACPVDNRDWYLTADKMTLHHDTGRGSARDVTLRFKEFPLLRLPWISFPMDDRRQSGFLLPGIGTSDDGLDFQLPYYFNLAPNRDATLTPRWITDRGPMLHGEYRYLGRRYVGQFNFEHMPNDDQTGDHRSYTRLQHRAVPAPRWRMDLDLNHVSDDRYFEDLSDSLAAASRSFLRSAVALTTYGESWRAGALLDAWETLDPAIAPLSEPYARLPRLTLELDRPLGRALRLELDGELVRFVRDEGLEGDRLDLYPRLSLPFYRPGYYAQSSLGVRHTQYDLERDLDATPSRTTPIASLEAGLLFDRTSERWLQTLEPRLYYLYVPFEGQDELPLFDTREFTFSFGQLFRPNRFSGADRQGDANQLTLALGTRLRDRASGRDVLDASLGTIVYLRDQRVQLRPGTAAREDTSPVVAEINYRPADPWRVNLGFQIEPDEERLEQAHFGVAYRGAGGRLVNFAYRRRSEVIDQLDVSMVAPIGERWTLIGRLNYSFQDDTVLEGLAGFEYRSCCWALRMFGRRYVRNLEGEQRDAIYLELELSGLGSLGRRTGPLLERAIVGFRSEDYFLNQ